ncbi:16710_t:CDS:2, partial [Gigaspora margarita]
MADSAQTSSSNVTKLLEFFHLCEKLKTTKRTGWIYNNVENPESISDHMYRMSILSLSVNDPTLDRDKCVKMSIVHDLAEAIVEALRHMCNDLLGNSQQSQEIYALWQEYEDATTKEAKFVRDIDKFEMILQAYEYEQSQNKNLEEFFESTKGRFTHPEVKSWVEELYKN